MSNDIQHITVTIDLDRWMPFDKESQDELDKLLFDIKCKRLLGHYGNVKTIVRII